MSDSGKNVGFKSVEYLYYRSDQNFVSLGHFGSNVGEVRMFLKFQEDSDCDVTSHLEPDFRFYSDNGAWNTTILI